jgi:hypothetical protein
MPSINQASLAEAKAAAEARSDVAVKGDGYTFSDSKSAEILVMKVAPDMKDGKGAREYSYADGKSGDNDNDNDDDNDDDIQGRVNDDDGDIVDGFNDDVHGDGDGGLVDGEYDIMGNLITKGAKGGASAGATRADTYAGGDAGSKNTVI